MIPSLIRFGKDPRQEYINRWMWFDGSDGKMHDVCWGLMIFRVVAYHIS